MRDIFSIECVLNISRGPNFRGSNDFLWKGKNSFSSNKRAPFARRVQKKKLEEFVGLRGKGRETRPWPKHWAQILPKEDCEVFFQDWNISRQLGSLTELHTGKKNLWIGRQAMKLQGGTDGKAVSQSVRQETTMFKSGNVPSVWPSERKGSVQPQCSLVLTSTRVWLLIVTRRYRWGARNRWTAEGEEDDEKWDRFRDPTGNSNNDNLMFLQEFATLSGWMARVICHSKVIKV